MKSCERSFEVEDLALGACDAELEAHVASCAACREALARFEEERALFAQRETALDAPPDFTLAVDLRLRREEALDALGRLAPLAGIADARGAASRIASTPARVLAAFVAAIVSFVRAARAAYGSWHVVHGVLGAAALAAAFLLVANAGGHARSAVSTEAHAEAPSAPLFTSARIASFVPEEPTTCFATDPSPTSHAESLACSMDARAVCEPNAGP